jgi:RNA polymerase sigma factor (sigma-70 family)
MFLFSSKKESEYSEVYSDHYAYVLRTIHSKIKNIDDAEDICHEVFVTLYNKFYEIKNYRGWLNQAINYAILNYINIKKNEDYSSIAKKTSDGSLTTKEEDRDLKLIIEEVIQNKDNYHDENENLIFDLVALKNFSYSQAAKELGKTKRQIEYTYRKICRRIVEKLRKKGISAISDIL